MRASSCLLALCLLPVGPVAATPRPAVEVRFIEPDRYTDANNRFGTGLGPEATLGEIRRLVEEAAIRVIAPGDRLVVEVLDVDLAGFPNLGINIPNGLRVVTDATPPAFRLRYRLTSGGRSIATGEERITDINFLFGARGAQVGSFPYERELLRDWARRRLSARR